MVCSGVLSQLLLLSLLSSGTTGVNEVNLNALEKIIAHIENTYQLKSGQNVIQTAVAVRFPADQCESGQLNPAIHLPSREDVISEIQNTSKDRVFVGENLVAARPVGKGDTAHHSEYILLGKIRDDIKTTPMNYLTSDHLNDCVVFYTYNSPCVNQCLNQNKQRYILPFVERLWETLTGPVAFVFNEIYQGTENVEQLLSLANKVFLYRCHNDNCAYCGKTRETLQASNCVATGE
ncbi:uncharacterized protein LOC121724589 [Alosa sapidissima]|uniref:uncharacterized protein LOC121724589 n=1 Tax=Alosa sapidissima TaxID=34773 RepID=UPI001C089AD0|nr:uncharacterized protein LOC121724589 [Alosa sapidissima]